MKKIKWLWFWVSSLCRKAYADALTKCVDSKQVLTHPIPSPWLPLGTASFYQYPLSCLSVRPKRKRKRKDLPEMLSNTIHSKAFIPVCVRPYACVCVCVSAFLLVHPHANDTPDFPSLECKAPACLLAPRLRPGTSALASRTKRRLSSPDKHSGLFADETRMFFSILILDLECMLIVIKCIVLYI